MTDPTPPSDIAIAAYDLGKYYHLKKMRQSSLMDSVNRQLARGLSTVMPNRFSPKAADPFKPYWALKDVSFEIKRGQVVGIIGRNGAGKSTLLKILSRITKPTLGRAVLRGRVGALLEVGSGFHPELTGRENIYMAGAMLGMTRAEITRRFDDIVEFSEVSNYIETPVKFYSSGMYVRLAFSVAAQLDVDVQIIDEVLTVGDIGFLAKSRKKIEEIASTGRTVIIVSHMIDMISEFCDRMLWIDSGQLILDGPPEAVILEYKKFLFGENYLEEHLRETTQQRERLLQAQRESSGKITQPKRLPTERE